MKNNIIEFINVSKKFEDFTALQNINFSVKRGETVVICGPSGSGKSTLIRCINGIDSYEKGSVIVNGRCVINDRKILTEIKKDVSMVFQSYNLFPHLTVLENLILGPIHVLGMDADAAIESTLHNLEKIYIRDQAYKYPGQLSGGQLQRAAIARSIVMESKIILLDEPTSALDPEMVGEVLDVITSMSKTGTTVVCVTHEMNFAKNIADRILFLDKGSLLVDLPPDDFFKNLENNRRLNGFLKKLLR
jgi:general L-amino acid transport system ATP-binding protein